MYIYTYIYIIIDMGNLNLFESAPVDLELYMGVYRRVEVGDQISVVS